MSDLIDRQEAIDVVIDACKKIPTIAIMAKYALLDLKPAQPERKKGAWINEGRIIRCNRCKIGYATVKGMKSALTYKFCPNCGADMRGDKNG